ncbi:hypothetical protein KKA15_04935 [Patescibacteria group bacterium]|nr:hypothetical protein [Patescibacteria group bacterium]
MNTKSIFPILVVLCIALLSACNSPKVVHVKNGDDLQAAIELAEPGSILIIEDGDYEQIFLKKSLTLINRSRGATIRGVDTVLGRGGVVTIGESENDSTVVVRLIGLTIIEDRHDGYKSAVRAIGLSDVDTRGGIDLHIDGCKLYTPTDASMAETLATFQNVKINVKYSHIEGFRALAFWGGPSKVRNCTIVHRQDNRVLKRWTDPYDGNVEFSNNIFHHLENAWGCGIAFGSDYEDGEVPSDLILNNNWFYSEEGTGFYAPVDLMGWDDGYLSIEEVQDIWPTNVYGYPY